MELIMIFIIIIIHLTNRTIAIVAIVVNIYRSSMCTHRCIKLRCLNIYMII